MNTYEKHIELLGCKAKDKITGLEGVIDSVCFDLYGCIQASIKPTKLDDAGKIRDGYWVDVTRLNIKTNTRVMEVPNFYEGYVAEGKKGPADKPASRA